MIKKIWLLTLIFANPLIMAANQKSEQHTINIVSSDNKIIEIPTSAALFSTTLNHALKYKPQMLKDAPPSQFTAGELELLKKALLFIKDTYYKKLSEQTRLFKKQFELNNIEMLYQLAGYYGITQLDEIIAYIYTNSADDTVLPLFKLEEYKPALNAQFKKLEQKVANAKKEYFKTGNTVNRYLDGVSIQDLIDHDRITLIRKENPTRVILDLSNQQINSIEGLEKIPHKKEVTILNLSHNLIKEIEEATLGSMLQLKKLLLNNNRIITIDNDILFLLVNLQELNLAHNQIHAIPKDCFITTYNLRWLNLSHNNVKTIAPHAFDDFRQQIMIDLSDNPISKKRQAMNDLKKQLPSNVIIMQ